MMTRCQHCGDERESWLIVQAELHVGQVAYWKLQLCPTCTQAVERAILEALASRR